MSPYWYHPFISLSFFANPTPKIPMYYQLILQTFFQIGGATWKVGLEGILTTTWNLFVLYFGASTLQKRAFSYQKQWSFGFQEYLVGQFFLNQSSNLPTVLARPMILPEPRPCYRPFPCWFVPCHPPSHPDSGWWLNQPICKICSSKRIISPIVGVKRKNIRNHHLVVESVTSCQANLPANFWNGRLRWEIEKPWKITRLALSWLGKPFLRVHLRWACINISLVTPPPRMTCGKWRVRLGFPTKTMYGNPGGDKTTSSG